MCHLLRATAVCLILEWAAAVERPPTASPVRKGLVVINDNPGGGKQRCEMVASSWASVISHWVRVRMEAARMAELNTWVWAER